MDYQWRSGNHLADDIRVLAASVVCYGRRDSLKLCLHHLLNMGPLRSNTVRGIKRDKYPENII